MEKRGFTKLLLTLLVLLLLTAINLGAGGQNEAGETAAAQVSGEKTPIEIYSSGYAFPTEKIEISYWAASIDARPGFHEVIEELLKEYMAIHPNITVTLRAIPNAQQRAIWGSAFESHTAGDVCWIEAQVGLMHNGLAEAPSWAVRMMEEQFTPFALGLGKIAGKYYGWTAAELDAGPMLYYNKAMYRENGMDPDSPPEDLPEWLAAAKKLTKYDSKGNIEIAGVALRYAGGHQGIGDKFAHYGAAFVDAREHFYYNKDYTDVTFDDPGWIECGQFFKDLVFKYKVTNTVLPVPIQAMGQKLAAMTNREAFFANWLKTNAPDVEYGIAPVVNGASPIGKYKVGAMPWLGMQGVTVDSKNPDIAWDFNMFMAMPDNEIRIVKNNGGMSRLKVHQDDPYFKTLPYYETVKYMLAERPLVRNRYSDPNALQGELEAKLGEVVVQLLTHPDSDPEELMKDLAAHGRKRLKEIK